MKRDGYGFCDVSRQRFEFSESPSVSWRYFREVACRALTSFVFITIDKKLTSIISSWLDSIDESYLTSFCEAAKKLFQVSSRPWCAWLKTSAPYIKQQGKPKGYEWTKQRKLRKQRFPMCSLHMLVWDSCLIFFVWKFSHCSTSFSLTRLEGSRGRTTLPAQGWWATGPQWLSTSIYKVKLRPCQNSLRAKPSNQSMPMCSCSGTTVLLPQKRRHVPIFVCLDQTCMVLCFSSLFEWNWWTFLRWQTTNGTVTVFVAVTTNLLKSAK